MNSTASKFSLERIALLLKRDISENWRSIFYFFLASYINVSSTNSEESRLCANRS